MFSEIAEIKSIREQKSKLSEREKELTEPILTDLDMIGMLYRWFQEIISQKEIFRSGNVTQRKKFIFIILFRTVVILSLCCFKNNCEMFLKC